jgi:hypothetical protein
MQSKRQSKRLTVVDLATMRRQVTMADDLATSIAVRLGANLPHQHRANRAVRGVRSWLLELAQALAAAATEATSSSGATSTTSDRANANK